ncbi:MAG TPA: hypothetical protein VG407_09800 [Caulobacteraceae bacterium]|jgi:hypothetical protein|nr:hypothetical protein [Caulobacteraceae bacterium]
MFHGWDNFFLTTGPAAGSLIGLLFVVVTLTAGRDRDSTLRGAALYLTPTVFHFGVVMAMSAAAMAPGLTSDQTALVLGAISLYGVGYTLIIALRLGKADGNVKPHWSDIWMYGVTPPIVYLLLLGATALEFVQPKLAPYVVAALLMTLLFMGIRNAWDLVTWMAPMVGQPSPSSVPAPPAEAKSAGEHT